MRKMLSFMLVLSCILVLFASCGGNDSLAGGNTNNGEKRVPVYQGMTITDTPMTSSVGHKFGVDRNPLLAPNNNGNGNNNGNNGNHYGNYKGDHADKDETIDEENPFPENNENETIEEEIKSSINVLGSPDTIYYAEPNQNIYINIHIDNPDSFEIMSFTLNGKKYSNYMFEDGSDMETIILEYNVGSASGIVEYTIDAIKYIDGTEIKDVIIDGNKTVVAGIKTKNQIAANVTSVDIDTNAISFKVNVKDNDNLIAFSEGALKAVIYDGFNVVAEKDLVVGENNVSFEGLETNTLYQYAVVGYYDDLSGDGFNMNVLHKDAFYTDSAVLFDNIVIWRDSIDFTLLWHEDYQGKNLTSLKLYKDGKLEKTLDTDATSIGGLLSASTYSIVAEYQNGDKTESIYLEFTTFEKGIPGFNFSIENITQTSVSFNIVEVDEENVGSITKIELIHASGTVVADSLDQRSFVNLLSGNFYIIRVTYTYNLNDGDGEQIVTVENKVKTLAKAIPIIEIGDIDIGIDSIKANHTVTDIEKTLINYKFELHNGTTLIGNSNTGIDFDKLNYYTEYTLKVVCTYDLSDGKGAQTSTNEYQYTTKPYIDVIGCNIANTSAVSEGETIFMQVTLDNPLGMSVESVVVNGYTYSVTNASTSKKIFVEIVYNGQFTGGDTYLKVDKINAKIDSTTLSVEPKTELSDNVFINGKLEVLKVEFVNETFEPIDWSFPSDTVYVLITLDNSTGYIIDSINGLESGWIKVDNNRIYKEVSGSFGWNEFSLKTLKYHNEYIDKTLSIKKMTSQYYKVKSDEVKYISSPNDLKSMVDGYYYELKNDIDLAGIEWIGSNCNGVFNGNGYAVKNMSFVGTTSESRFGLFNQIKGVVSDLNIIDATLIVEANSTNKDHIYSGFLGIEIDGILRKITVKDSVISIANSNGGVYIGGIVQHNKGKIEQCSIVDCNISIGASSEFYVGGISSQNIGTIDGCYFQGNMNCQSTYYSGTMQYGCPAISGIVANNIGMVINCFATGTIEAGRIQSIGGIIGNNTGYVHYNVSNIRFVDSNSSYLGGVCGDTWGEGKVSCNFTNIATRVIGGKYNALDAENNFSINDMSETEFYNRYLKDNKYWRLEDNKILFVS